MNISELIKEAHDNAVERGFYPDGEEKNIGELLMLIVSELGEALEAHRCGRFADWDMYDEVMDELKDNPAYKSLPSDLFNRDIKDTFEDEIADVFIRLFDLCGYLEIPIEKHIKAKMTYNRTRPHKHNKEY